MVRWIASPWAGWSSPTRSAWPQLESIVHPAVAVQLEAAIREADAGRPAAIVLEAIKLVEAGHAPWCDEVWLVVCGSEAQFDRLVGRGMPEPDARQRIAAQADSLALWRSAATRAIRTDGPRDVVERAVDTALRETLVRHPRID